MPLSYAKDIRPLFRIDPDISCMRRRGVLLDDAGWMCQQSNAQRVYDQVSSGSMPMDGPWPKLWVVTFKQWMDEGCKP